jgi:hypothetical protein
MTSARALARRLTETMSFWLVLILLTTSAAVADIGPKPTMEFEFSFIQVATANLTAKSGVLYECEKADGSDGKPLKGFGPQRFTCESDSCFAMAYGFAPYHRLEIKFSDGKTRRSNVFKTAGLSSKYAVTVREDDLLVKSVGKSDEE